MPDTPRPGAVVVDAATIAATVRRMAGEVATLVAADAEGNPRRPLLVIGVLKGSLLLCADLARALAALAVPLEIEFIAVRSYARGTSADGSVELVKDVGVPLRDRDVLIVEDVVDTGLTTAFLLDHLRRHRPRSLRLLALLDKPGRRRVAVPLDVVGVTLGDGFVVGYGLDLDERWRELPDVHLLDGAP